MVLNGNAKYFAVHLSLLRDKFALRSCIVHKVVLREKHFIMFKNMFYYLNCNP